MIQIPLFTFHFPHSALCIMHFNIHHIAYKAPGVLAGIILKLRFGDIKASSPGRHADVRVVHCCHGHIMGADGPGGAENAVRGHDVHFQPLLAPDLREIAAHGDDHGQIAPEHILDPLPELSARHTPQSRHFCPVQPEENIEAPGEHIAVDALRGDDREKAAVQLREQTPVGFQRNRAVPGHFPEQRPAQTRMILVDIINKVRRRDDAAAVFPYVFVLREHLASAVGSARPAVNGADLVLQCDFIHGFTHILVSKIERFK